MGVHRLRGHRKGLILVPMPCQVRVRLAVGHGCLLGLRVVTKPSTPCPCWKHQSTGFSAGESSQKLWTRKWLGRHKLLRSSRQVASRLQPGVVPCRWKALRQDKGAMPISNPMLLVFRFAAVSLWKACKTVTCRSFLWASFETLPMLPCGCLRSGFKGQSHVHRQELRLYSHFLRNLFLGLKRAR